jgi:dGTPase
VVDRLEKEGKGLNLSFEVRDGILHHTKAPTAQTLEGHLVLYSDRIAYLNHDIEDAVRAGVLAEEEIPKAVTDVLGTTKSERITTLIHSVVNNSQDGVIQMDPVVAESFQTLHRFMTDHVYRNPKAKSEESKVPLLIETLYDHFRNHLEELPALMQQIALEEGADRAVMDYIAGMTDHFAVTVFQELYIPKFWKI